MHDATYKHAARIQHGSIENDAVGGAAIERQRLVSVGKIAAGDARDTGTGCGRGIQLEERAEPRVFALGLG